jgi:hypothetical protein
VRLFSTATGDAPLGFQWLFNNLPISGATGTSLVLTNVQPFQAGQYAVQVTNLAGSITSFPATLGITGTGTLPMITPQIVATRSGSEMLLSFQSNVGRIYSWQFSTNLSSWSVVSNLVSAGSTEQLLVSPSPVAPAQYFRVSSP